MLCHRVTTALLGRGSSYSLHLSCSQHSSALPQQLFQQSWSETPFPHDRICYFQIAVASEFFPRRTVTHPVSSELGPPLSGETMGGWHPPELQKWCQLAGADCPNRKALSLTGWSNFAWSEGWLHHILGAEQLTAAVLTTPDEWNPSSFWRMYFINYYLPGCVDLLLSVLNFM